LPNKTHVYLYGGLSGQAFKVSPLDLMSRGMTLEGFYLPKWLESITKE